jgi:5-formyltetrahydrofolate cyclo-ligase
MNPPQPQPDDPKRALRQDVRAALRATTPESRAAWSELICARLDGLDAVQHARLVVAFMPLELEPDLIALIRRLDARGVAVALPRVDWSGTLMDAAQVTDLERDVVPGRFGLREPRPDLPPVQPQDINAVLVPGVAFDAAGGRLGRGGGFYDRFLATLGPGARRIGVAFELQIVRQVPTLPHDLHMHEIVTEACGRACPAA